MDEQHSFGEGGGAAPPAARAMRSDAVLNRKRILEAAAEVFAAQGVSVPIDVVAERAGVGVGTLYRHFPTKEDLFAAIVATKIADLVEACRVAADDGDPEEAFFSFVRLLASEAAMKQDLFDALEAAGVDKSRFAPRVDELEARLGDLLSRAVSCGAVRRDVRADDVIGLVIGTCHGARRMGRDGNSTQRLIGILCEGLRPGADER
jgi:AcrR family transcriptional regulator